MKIDFEFTTRYGVFRDAIYLPDDHGVSDKELDNIKQQRLDAWLSLIESPPAVVEDEPASSPPPQVIEIAGEAYHVLTDVPPSGAQLIEANGTWYIKA